MTAPPEVGDVGVHQKHGQECEEPESIDLIAMFQHLHLA